MNLRPIPSKNACIIRKDFVQESQHFIIRKTPYYINVPGEITFLPRNKGFFPRLLIKIMRVFQQNCRKKYHPEPEFLEFPQKTPESNLDYQSITNEKKEKTSPLDEVFFTQNQMKDSSEEIIKKNNDSFGSLLPGQSIKNSTKAHDKSEEEGEKIEPSNKRLEKNEEQNRFLNYNASSNRILEKKETFRKPIVEKNRKWMRKAKDILSQKQKLYEQKSKFNANMYKVQEDNGYENRINHGKRKRKVFLDELIEKNIKFKRNYDYESIDRKYIHNNHFYELPRKKIHREETKNIFSKHLKDEVKSHRKYEFLSLNFNDSNDDDATQSEQSSPKKNEIENITEKIYSKLQESDKFKGFSKPEIIIEIIKGEESQENKGESPKTHTETEEKKEPTSKENKIIVTNNYEKTLKNSSEASSSVFKIDENFLNPSQKISKDIKNCSRKGSIDLKNSQMKNENYIKPCEKQFDSIISKNCNETININLQPERKNSFKQPESPLKSESKNSFLIPSSRKNSDRGNNKQPESPLQVSSDSKNPFLLQNSMLHESLDDFVKKMNDTSSKNTEKINSIKNSNFSYRQEDNNENPFLAKVLLSPQNDLKNHTKSNSDLIPESPIKSLISNPLINTIHNQNSQNNAILNESFINKNNNLTNSSTITTEPINQHINNFNNNSLLNAFPENLTNNQATTKPHSTIPNFLANANQSPSNPQFFSNLLGNNANTNMENAFTPNFTTKSSGGIFGGLLEKTNIFGFNNNASEANHMNDTTGFQSSLFSNFHDPMGSTNSSSNTNLKGNKKRKQRVNN